MAAQNRQYLSMPVGNGSNDIEKCLGVFVWFRKQTIVNPKMVSSQTHLYPSWNRRHTCENQFANRKYFSTILESLKRICYIIRFTLGRPIRSECYSICVKALLVWVGVVCQFNMKKVPLINRQHCEFIGISIEGNTQIRSITVVV